MIFELMGKSKASALVHEPSCETLVQDCLVPTFSTDVWGIIPASDTQLDRVTTSLSPDQVSVIFHTSGSTSGMPKLVPATVKWMDCLIRKSKPGLGSDPQMVCNLM
jgi:acyl-coenzyme A synthetase/AMP-(fatty) acid ligase